MTSIMFDEAEMLCILMEELSGQVRPEGVSAEQALKEATIASDDPEIVVKLRRAVQRIMKYIIASVVEQVPGAQGGMGPRGRTQ